MKHKDLITQRQMNKLHTCVDGKKKRERQQRQEVKNEMKNRRTNEE